VVWHGEGEGDFRVNLKYLGVEYVADRMMSIRSPLREWVSYVMRDESIVLKKQAALRVNSVNDPYLRGTKFLKVFFCAS
jgi:hypothetical protein